MKRISVAGLLAGAMIFVAGTAYAQTQADSWSPAGAAAADPGSAPAQIHKASGTDSFLSIPMKTEDSTANSSGGSDAWAPAGGAAADSMRPRIVADIGKDGWL